MMFSFKKQQTEIKAAWLLDGDAYTLTPDQEAALSSFTPDESGMVLLGQVAQEVLGQQTQYVSYFLEGIGGRPNLSMGLRVDVSAAGGNYHCYRINKDDAHTFIGRVLAFQNRPLI